MLLSRLLSSALLCLSAGSGVVALEATTYASAHPDGRVAFSFDASAWNDPESARHLPIGVFDSGIGGLTVLDAILTLDVYDNASLAPGPDGVADFIQERFIYLGDQANMPYGHYPAVGRTDFLRELIVKDAIFLLGRRAWPSHGEEPHFDKSPVKAIVIACNTATAYGLEDIRAAMTDWKIPVIVVGVVEAGARGVLEIEQNGGIGVLATVGTCASNAYPRAITSTLGLAGHPVPEIVQQGSVSLAGAIEGNPDFPESVATYTARDVRALAETYRSRNPTKPLSTIVLGCTHFPLVESEIDAALAALRAEDGWQDLIAEQRTYVNPATATARELFRSLAQAGLRLKSGETCVLPQDQFYLSVPRQGVPGVTLEADGGLEKAYKYARMPGQFVREDTKNVPLTPALLPPSSATLLRTRLQAVWERLEGR